MKISTTEINKFNEHGYFRYHYNVTDNSKHVHVVFQEVSISALEYNQPCFKLLTTSSVGSIYPDGNSDLNLHLLTEKVPIICLTR